MPAGPRDARPERRRAFVCGLLLACGGVACGQGTAPTPSREDPAASTGEAVPKVQKDASPERASSPPPAQAPPPDYASMDDDGLAQIYKKMADALDEGPLTDGQRVQLRAVATHANDPHLQANARLALGSLAEGEGRLEDAIVEYREVVSLVPREPAGHAVLAMALAARSEYDEAIAAQRQLVELDPDDLQAWLIWGELEVKAGHGEQAAKVYAGYEMRRKGLLDGLTLQKDGAYRLRPEDRADCASALAAAPDNGTAMGLLYALSSDPEPSVRAAIVRAMGAQRFVGYLKPLEHHLTVEQTPEVKVATLAAIGEIRANPVETRPGVAPGTATPAPSEGAPPSKKGAPVGE